MTGTDKRVYYAESNAGCVTIPCILDTGTITVTKGYGPTGKIRSQAVNQRDYGKGEWVSLFVDNDMTAEYAVTGGLPMVTKNANGANFAIGRIVSTPEWAEGRPTESFSGTLKERMAGKLYMRAEVQLFNLCGMAEGVVICNGTNDLKTGATTVAVKAAGVGGEGMGLGAGHGDGVGVPLVYDASGTGMVLLTPAPKGVSGDLVNVLVGFTGGCGKVVT